MINDCFETQPQTHILCCRWESGRSLNLIDEFSLLKSENKSILFLSTTVFLQLLIDNVGDTEQISCWRQKIIDEKKLSTTFCLVCQQPYTKSQLPSKIFDHPSGVFWTTGRMGPGDFRQLKKRRHQLFKQQILLPLYHWHACRIILPARPIIVSKVLVGTLVFCFIGFYE